jgi:hypothetical protein
MRNFLFSIVLFLVSPFSEACSSPQLTDEELFLKARTVFRARVIETKVAKFSNPSNPLEVAEVVEAKIEVREIYKGEPPSSGIVREFPFGIGGCSLGLLAGVEYVFFPTDYDFVFFSNGSFGFENPEAKGMKKRLDELRNWGKRAQQ